MNIDPRTAEQLYYENKKKYNDAYNAKCTSQKKEANYCEQRGLYNAQLSKNNALKHSIEQRIEDIERILDKFFGRRVAAVAENVSECISEAASVLVQLSESFTHSFTMVGGIGVAAKLQDVFETKIVEKDVVLSRIVDKLTEEKHRLEEQLEKIERNIKESQAVLEELQRKINLCNLEQMGYTRQMNTYAYEMNYYKKFMR